MDHADGFGSGASADYPMLEVGDERLALVGVAADDVSAGARVRVRGHRDGTSFVVADDKRAIELDSSPVRAPSPTSGTTGDAPPSNARSVAVLLINFVDEALTTPTPKPPAMRQASSTLPRSLGALGWSI